MRSTPIVLAMALLAAFAVRAGEPAAGQEGQAPAAAAPSPSGAQGPASTREVSAGPAAAAAAEDAVTPVAAGAGNAASAASSAGNAGSEAITLRLTPLPPQGDFKPPPGYKPVKRGLETVYCTTVTPIGSRMPEKQCLTQAQVEQVQRQAEMDRQRLREKVHPGGTSAN